MKKRKFTWIDGVLVAILAIVLAIGAYLLLRELPEELQAVEKPYLVTLQFNQVSEKQYDGYAVGDTLYFQDRLDIMGTIESVKETEKQIERYDPNQGKYVIMTDPSQKAVELTVLVRGQMDKGKLTVMDQHLHIGKLFYPQSDTTRSTMTILDIEEVAA